MNEEGVNTDSSVLGNSLQSVARSPEDSLKIPEKKLVVRFGTSL